MLKVLLIRGLGNDTGHFSKYWSINVLYAGKSTHYLGPARADKAPSLIFLTLRVLLKGYFEY